MLLLGVSSCQEGRDTLDGYWSNSGSGVGSSSAFMSGRWDVDDTGADDDSTTVVVDNVVEAVLMGLLEVVGGEAPNSDLSMGRRIFWFRSGAFTVRLAVVEFCLLSYYHNCFALRSSGIACL